MKTIFSLLLAGLAAASLAAIPAFAQPVQTGTEISAGNTLLTVTAEGKTFREPDLAVFSAGVTTQATTAAEALADNSRAMQRVIAALKNAGIAERDIQTSNLSINPVYADPNRDAVMASRATGAPYMPPPPEMQLPTIIGYQANNTVSVRQRKLGDYGEIIDALASAGANQVNGPNFQLDEPEPALDEARRDAMTNARERAQLYADAAGLRIVRIVSISESGGYWGPQPVSAFARESMAGAPPPPPPAPVQPGEMQMNASVTVQYELSR